MDDFFAKHNCDRCGKPLIDRIMSVFNSDVICGDCKQKEKNHPNYTRAVQAELDAVMNGDDDFPGLGLS